MRNRGLIIQPTVERFLSYIGEGNYKKTGKMRNQVLITTLALLHIFILHRRGNYKKTGKMRNRHLIIKPTVERFLFYIGERNIELARQVDIVNFRPQLMDYYILLKNQIVHSIWTSICGYKGKEKTNEVRAFCLK